ncbi:tRNA (guanosine(37)-N1)-methyltransferase TrmD [Salinispira pacifica]|uniref:tRNA (guanine-N(1)-)-methyltransferase n=1 Tax=Salinispira pacifica TaxID=1307761 RepID=V5WH25_9SPIO|nr:tRNA (guanosine(37)-N1)-methyltransferase TrmD [Salinispira pacifica]AHC15122.1 tRNA (Guanine37-N1)-methyltransferase [Salinispira pacifica]
MKLKILTLFPEIIQGFFQSSIMAKAVERGIIDYQVINFREYAADKHRTADSYPYGGGAGMVLKCEPIAAALDAISSSDQSAARRIVYPSPSGTQFTQAKALELSQMDELVFICGRYEGLDQRIIEEYVDDEISVGDYVLSSGEIGSLVIIDAVYRLLDGVINSESLLEESHEDGVLEYPHYTRPEEFRGRTVPPVLLSGHHEKIRKWRRKQGLKKTLRNRPDLLENRKLSKEDEKLLSEIEQEDDHGSD